jgi:hypothetical protein
MGIKIRIGDDGRVAPETMALLGEFARHRNGCVSCRAVASGFGRACPAGEKILRALAARPDVENYQDEVGLN